MLLSRSGKIKSADNTDGIESDYADKIIIRGILLQIREISGGKNQDPRISRIAAEMITLIIYPLYNESFVRARNV
jgi:hypothetical protein